MEKDEQNPAKRAWNYGMAALRLVENGDHEEASKLFAKAAANAGEAWLRVRPRSPE